MNPIPVGITANSSTHIPVLSAGPEAARVAAQAHVVAPHHHGAQRAEPAAAQGPQRGPARVRAARPARLTRATPRISPTPSPISEINKS